MSDLQAELPRPFTPSDAYPIVDRPVSLVTRQLKRIDPFPVVLAYIPKIWLKRHP